MRGEDVCTSEKAIIPWGSPPHARGRQQDLLANLLIVRITPACAGKTSSAERPCDEIQDHPRMRGEDPTIRTLPALGQRITPACAGKTPSSATATRRRPDHPRMRGEDCAPTPASLILFGSPPHARGRPRKRAVGPFGGGITPACAGKTITRCGNVYDYKDHPRMRGEDLGQPMHSTSPGGSPPHARGRQYATASSSNIYRITPACAGKTVRFPRESGKVVFQPTSFPSLPT